MVKYFKFFCLMCVILFSAASAQAATVEMTDFIGASERTNFNSFEAIGSVIYSGYPYTEDGITVEQVNGLHNVNGIWTTYFSPDGDYGWFPNGGDYGYTSITRADGSDFVDIGFMIQTGINHDYVYYALLNNGSVVLSGFFNLGSERSSSLGFSGGGFDTVLVRDSEFDDETTPFPPSGIHSTTNNALSIDAIELRGTAVPEPASFLLLGLGMAGLAAFRKRRNQA